MHDTIGMLPALSVLQAAKNPKSPLHDCFEWNDGEAAEQFRLTQARKLCSHFTIIERSNGGAAIETKAFYSIRISAARGTEDSDEDSGPRAYFSTERIRNDPRLAAAVVEDARRDLIAWKNRYLICRKAFEPVFKEIETIEAQESSAAAH